MERELIKALMGEHVDLYRNSAPFHHGINTLATMLPAMVNGLAAQAEEQEGERLERIEALMREPWQPRWPIPGRD